MNTHENPSGKPTVVLIQPRSTSLPGAIRFVPHGLLAVASTIPKDYQVVIVDRSIRPDNSFVQEILNDKHVVCVGFSVMTGNSIRDALELSNYIKHTFPNIPIVWGGWHATQVPLSVLEQESIDYIIRGEGEVAFPLLLNTIVGIDDIESIDGVGFKQNGSIHLNPTFPPLNIDHFPSRPYHLLGDLQPYIIPNWIPLSNRCISMESSRGCPYGCTFCEIYSHFGKSYSYLSPEHLHAEVVSMMSTHGVDGINFCDANFFLNMERVRNFCKLLIDSNTNLAWGCSGTIMQFSHVKDEDLLLFKRAGLTSIAFGVESASERVRKEILQKKFTNDQLRNVACKLDRIGIQMKIYMMLGIPGEKVEDSLENVDFTIELIEKYSNLATSGSMNIYIPFPKTELSSVAESMGYEFPKTLEGFATLSSRGASGLRYLSKEHLQTLRNISLMSTFLCMTKSNIFFTGGKQLMLSIARSFYKFRLKKHILLSTPDLYILKKIFKA